jgi:hypothetical protein
MERAFPTPAVAADAAAVTEVVAALESSLYGQTSFSQADLEDEWSDINLGAGRACRATATGSSATARCASEGSLARRRVRPPRRDRARIGKLIATGLEEAAAAAATQNPKRRV